MATWIGIDIGTTAVKVAVVRTAYRKRELTALVSVDIGEVETPVSMSSIATPSSTMRSGRSVPPPPPPELAGPTFDAIRRAILLAMGTGRGASGDGVASSIPGDRVAVRVLALPESVHKQIAEVLPFELESDVPFEMSESVFDHRVLRDPPGPRPAKGEKEDIRVLAVVAPTEVVKARIDLVRAALGVEPDVIGASGFPLGQLVAHTPALNAGTPVVVLDLGTRTSDVVVLVAGEIVFARTLSLGTQGLPGSASRLAREIRMSIAAFRAQGGEVPSALFLAGGGAFVSGAESFLSAELEMEVSLLPPPQLEMPTVAPDAIATMPKFAKAVGMALGLSAREGGINLRQGSLTYERGYGWIKEKIPVVAGLVTVLLVSFLFSSTAKLLAAGKEKDVYSKALATVTKEVLGEETSDANHASELLASQTAFTDEDPLPHADAFDVMMKLSEMIPPSIVHDVEELDVNKGHVVIHGIVGSIPDAQSISTSLATERCFADVKVKSTTQVVGGERQKYVLEFDLKCPEDQKKKKDSSGTTPAASGTGGK
ncbi:MAG: pilus assembly protein PilM [Polyangiaceae bacterium]